MPQPSGPDAPHQALIEAAPKHHRLEPRWPAHAVERLPEAVPEADRLQLGGPLHRADALVEVSEEREVPEAPRPGYVLHPLLEFPQKF